MVCGLVTEVEVLDTIKKLNLGKAPGLDGFSPDFYKHYSYILADILAKFFNEILNNNSIPYSLKQAIIVLFFKKGNEFLLGNYHPISLTNFDYKILAYVLTARLQMSFSTVIYLSQLAYLRGRFIGTNICKVQDAIDTIKREDMDLVIIVLDFYKAFDSVSHTFLLQLLTHMNYPSSLIGWIKLIYDDARAIVRHKGWCTQEFQIRRGVLQGCPLSCHLFNLVSQTLIYCL